MDETRPTWMWCMCLGNDQRLGSTDINLSKYPPFFFHVPLLFLIPSAPLPPTVQVRSAPLLTSTLTDAYISNRDGRLCCGNICADD